MRRIVRLSESDIKRLVGGSVRKILMENHADRTDVTRSSNPTIAALGRVLRDNPCGLSDEELISNMRFIDAYRGQIPRSDMHLVMDYQEEADNRRLVW